MNSPIRPELLFGSRARMAVLRQLVGVSVPLSTLEVARRSGLSQPGAAEALRELSRLGVVESTLAGRAWIHSIVRENQYVIQVIEPVFAAEQAIMHELIEEIRTSFADVALSCVVFGSYARDEARVESDFDLVLVGVDDDEVERLNRMLDEISARIRTRYGVRLSALVYTRRDAAMLGERSPALSAEVERDGLLLAGLPYTEWALFDDAQR